MTIKRILFCALAIGALLVLATMLLGHLWVFIIIVLTAFGGIVWGLYQQRVAKKVRHLE